LGGVLRIRALAVPAHFLQLNWNRLDFAVGAGWYRGLFWFCWTGMACLPGQLQPPDLLSHPSVPNDGRQTTGDHQDWEIPQRIIADAGTGTEKHLDTGQLVANCLIGQLHGGQGDDTDDRRVEAREERVDGQREGLANGLDTKGQGVHAYSAGETA
jgi:hypothetical protein